MIYVRRDFSKIPKELLDKAEKAQKELEALPEEKRAEFINKKADIWRAFKECLSTMSYGKCWYSESPLDQTFHDVDHFRPKLAARRSETEIDRGYEWLAFSPENFRLSAQRSNRPSTNEETKEVDGKADWFPLLDGSPKAHWGNRCETNEKPALLDPTNNDDVRLVEVKADARLGPSRVCLGTNVDRVAISIKLLGLDLPNLTAARRRVMRDVASAADVLLKTIEQGSKSKAFADASPIHEMISALQRKTWPQEPYAAAARAALRLAGLASLCAMPEEIEGG